MCERKRETVKERERKRERQREREIEGVKWKEGRREREGGLREREMRRVLEREIDAHWVQNRFIINLWQQCIEGDREFKTKGIIGGGRWGYQCYQNYHPIEG